MSDVLCPRIPGTLTELKKKRERERKRERKRKKERRVKKEKKRRKREWGKKKGDKETFTNHYVSFIARKPYAVTENKRDSVLDQL